MNKQKIIFSLLIFTFIFSISLISSTIYQTPGYVPVQEPTPSDVPVTAEVPADVQEDSTNEISTFWIFVMVIAFMVLVFLVIKQRSFKRRKRINNYENLSKTDEIEDTIGSLVEQESEPDKLQEEADKKMEEEADEMMDELGLKEVKDKTKEVEEDEH